MGRSDLRRRGTERAKESYIPGTEQEDREKQILRPPREKKKGEKERNRPLGRGQTA